jgi:hypothetical protein
MTVQTLRLSDFNPPITSSTPIKITFYNSAPYFGGYDLNLFEDPKYKYHATKLKSSFLSLSLRVEYDPAIDKANNQISSEQMAEQQPQIDFGNFDRNALF